MSTIPDRYESPFSNRYGSEAMRRLWGKKYELHLWTEFWVQLMRTQVENGVILLSDEDKQTVLDWCSAFLSGITDEEYTKSLDLEKSTRHDLVSVLWVFSERLPSCVRGALHLGCTSSDVEDYADYNRVMQSLDILQFSIKTLIRVLSGVVLDNAEEPIMGYTHLQPAEPTTLGYRLAVCLQELSACFEVLEAAKSTYREKDYPGGPVGTKADLEKLYKSRTGKGVVVNGVACGQTMPRVQEVRIATSFMSMASVLHKLGLDFRIMQSQGSVWYAQGVEYVGSSSMPNKSNPILAEKICSLARRVPGITRDLWDASSNSALERTLDDSAVRRTALPELFLVMDELVRSATQLLVGMKVQSRTGRMMAINRGWKTWVSARVVNLTLARNPHRSRSAVVTAIEKQVDNVPPDEVPEYSIEDLCLGPASDKARRVSMLYGKDE